LTVSYPGISSADTQFC